MCPNNDHLHRCLEPIFGPSSEHCTPVKMSHIDCTDQTFKVHIPMPDDPVPELPTIVQSKPMPKEDVQNFMANRRLYQRHCLGL